MVLHRCFNPPNDDVFQNFAGYIQHGGSKAGSKKDGLPGGFCSLGRSTNLCCFCLAGKILSCRYLLYMSKNITGTLMTALSALEISSRPSCSPLYCRPLTVSPALQAVRPPLYPVQYDGQVQTVEEIATIFFSSSGRVGDGIDSSIAS